MAKLTWPSWIFDDCRCEICTFPATVGQHGMRKNASWTGAGVWHVLVELSRASAKLVRLNMLLREACVWF